MKKFFASATFIFVFAFYALYQNLGAASAAPVAQSVPSSASQTTDSPTLAANQPAATLPSQPVAAATPAPVATSQGKYKDGTYTGSSADAYYGNVQVQVTIANGKIASVSFLDYPQDRGTSREINAQAMPLLTREAIQAQSANVSGVSGASDTSAAFRQSLAVALSKAA